MDFYIIPTIHDLELSLIGDRIFCLAHFYKKYTHYREFFLRLKESYPSIFITLDNSAAEKSLVTEEVLLGIVAELKPSEVISPDVLFDKKTTLKNLDSFIHQMKSRELINHTNIFGCPQGSTKDEWLECYDYMNSCEDVKTIGLSKITVPYVWEGATRDQRIKESRQACMDFLVTSDRLQTPLHLLGMGDPTEYRHYLKYNNSLIRSSDSCYTVLAASRGIDLSINPGNRVETTDEFYEVPLSRESLLLSMKNISFLKLYSMGGNSFGY